MGGDIIVQETINNTFIDSHLFYKGLVSEFRSKNQIVQLAPDSDSFAVFVYNSDFDRIVYADNSFLKIHRVSNKLLQRQGMRRYIFSRLRKEDAHYVQQIEKAYYADSNTDYINRVVGLKQTDNSFRFFHFLLFNLRIINISYSHLFIGVQIRILSDMQHHLQNKELRNCQKKMALLSVREKEVLTHIVNGCTDKEVGESLNISSFTAQKHRKNILKKLDEKNTASLSFIAGKASLM